MPAITLKNLPDTLHTELKQRARRHHRSLNREVIAVLQEAVVRENRDPSHDATLAPPSYRAPHLPLPSFHGGVAIPADFNLEEAIRAENQAADKALADRLYGSPSHG